LIPPSTPFPDTEAFPPFPPSSCPRLLLPGCSLNLFSAARFPSDFHLLPPLSPQDLSGFFHFLPIFPAPGSLFSGFVPRVNPAPRSGVPSLFANNFFYSAETFQILPPPSTLVPFLVFLLTTFVRPPPEQFFSIYEFVFTTLGWVLATVPPPPRVLVAT